MALVIRNIGKLYGLEGLVNAGGRASAHVKPCVNAIVVAEGGFISYAGETDEIPSSLEALRDVGTTGGEAHGSGYNPYPATPGIVHQDREMTVIDAKGALVTPGLVDSHTHVLYGGDRAHEVALKVRGVPYLEILAGGGGILATVKATRAASDEELYEAASTRLMTMVRQGATTVEIKTGYGLSLDEELRHLRIIRDLAEDLPIRIVPTFMGAHATPPEFRSDRAGYVAEVIERMLPAVAEQGIAQFCDVFCEPGVFSVAESEEILQTAASIGVERKVHADEIGGRGDDSGAAVASRVGAKSADHLRATDSRGMRLLSDSGTIPVLLPSTTFCLGEKKYADAREMIDEFDLPVALATDCNPGTSPTESLQFVMALAALHLKMTPPEILAGVTINAARALGMQDSVGSLEPGKGADVVIWQAYDLDVLPYRFGSNQASTVIAGGEVIA